jgi:hypothetical protein
MGTYDMLEVVIGGETMQARPVAWAEEVPIKFQTTCPKCSQLIEFDGHDFVCASCGTPGAVKNNPPPPVGITVAVFPDLKNVGMVEQKIPKGPILDPLDEGLFPKDLLDLQYLEKS